MTRQRGNKKLGFKKRKKDAIKLKRTSFVRINKQTNKGKKKLLNKVWRKRNKEVLKKDISKD